MKRIYLLPFMAMGLVACSDDLEEHSSSVSTLTEEDFERFNLEALNSTNHKISADKAESAALELMSNYCSQNGLKSGVNRKVANVQIIGSSNSLKSASQDTLAYIVNFADNMGYAYVCADDRLSSSVLAFFEKGNYSENMNPAAKLMFDKTENYIKRTIYQFENNKDELMLKAASFNETSNKNSLKYYYVRKNQVGPLLKTHWGQESPYNYYCRTCTSPGCNNKGLTGCMNTALAQIMYYHKWPEKLTLDNGKSYDLQWDYCDINTFSLADYVASGNMAEIGILLNSTYRCNAHGGTATSRIETETLIPQKLGYTCMDFDYSWSSTKDFIDNGYPMLVIGALSKSSHAWVIDGYFVREKRYNSGKYKSSTTYVHNNWGWNGTCDGYFEKNCFDTQDAFEYDYGRSKKYDYEFHSLKMRWLFPIR